MKILRHKNIKKYAPYLIPYTFLLLTANCFSIHQEFSWGTSVFGQGVWTKKADFGGTARYGATGFSIGSKGYIGTGIDPLDLKDFWEYNQTTNTWTKKADFGGTARWIAAGLSINNKGYIGTGQEAGGNWVNDFWEYNPGTNFWTKKTYFGVSTFGISVIERRGATGFSVGNKGYIGTGNTMDPFIIYHRDFWEYDPAANTWTQKADFGGPARRYAVGFSIGNKGYIGTGGTDFPTFTDFWEYDPATNAWTKKADFPGVPRLGAVGFAINCKGYIGTGSDFNYNELGDFYEYDPAANTWTAMANFPGTARSAAVGFAIGNKGYIGTGWDGGGTLWTKDFWEYTPPNPCNALNITVSVKNLLCNSQCTGTATVTPTSGTTPYTYTWSNAQTTQVITGLCAATYSVFVTDASGATATANVTITQPSAITTSTTATPAACGSNNGNATVSASGGTPSYTYLWNNGNTTSSSWQLAVGSYSVLVTDANNCTQTATVAVTQTGGPTVFTSSTPQTCTQGGTATAIASVGTTPYTYQWCNGQSASTATGLTAGNCTVIVTDANGCSTIDTVTIASSGNIPVVNVTSVPASCNNNDGNATANVSGGTSPYTYSWSNGNTTSSSWQLAVGSYSVLVTDANNCTQTATVAVTQTGGPTAVVGTTATILSGNSTSLNASGGITYSWSPSTGLNCTTCANPVASPTVTIEYCVYVFDTSGCFDSACVTVYVIDPLDCDGAGELFVPNAFSPNGDNENDALKIYYGDLRCIETFKLVIYNRWGEKVFSATDPSKAWDGMYRGKHENTAVFVYYLKATLISGKEIIRKGNVSLVR